MTRPLARPALPKEQHPWASRWTRHWADVRNEEWLAAARLLDLSPRVRGYFACYLDEVTVPVYDDTGKEIDARTEPVLDWDAAAEHIDAEGLSSTEHRLARLVAALTTGAPLDLATLTLMGSWADDVWRVLVEWASQGRITTRHRL